MGGLAAGSGIGASLGAVGAAFGPIGAIAGALFGTFLGGLFEDDPRGAAFGGFQSGNRFIQTGHIEKDGIDFAPIQSTLDATVGALSQIAEQLHLDLSDVTASFEIASSSGAQFSGSVPGGPRWTSGFFDPGNEEALEGGLENLISHIVHGLSGQLPALLQEGLARTGPEDFEAFIELAAGIHGIAVQAEQAYPGLVEVSRQFAGGFKEYFAQVQLLIQVTDTLKGAMDALGLASQAGQYTLVEFSKELMDKLGPQFLQQSLGLFIQEFGDQGDILERVIERLQARIDRRLGVSLEDFAETLSIALSTGNVSLSEALLRLMPLIAQLRDAEDQLGQQSGVTAVDLSQLTESIREFRRGLQTSELAQLSPEEQFRKTRRRFRRVSRRAQAGDLNAIEQLRDVAQEYLQAAQGYFASSPQYFQIFDNVTQVLRNVEALLGSPEPQITVQPESSAQQP